MRIIKSIMTLGILGCFAFVIADEYSDLHKALIGFYKFQRAGNATSNSCNPFYKTTPYPHSGDKYGSNDLSGGWYDAGDFVKFGLPLGYTTYCLLIGYDAFPKSYDDLGGLCVNSAADQIPDILNEVKVATDYLCKAVIDANTIVMDVGNGPADHGDIGESGYTNSSRISSREIFLATGADVPGLYCAALAAMSRIYKPYDAAYSATCLAKAKLAFQFCNSHKNKSTKFQIDPNNPPTPYYDCPTWADKMACGAIELFLATKDSTYLTSAKTLMQTVGRHNYVLGYANTGDLAAYQFDKIGIANYTANWLGDVNLAITRVVTATGTKVTGAFINSNWGVCRNASTAGFSAALGYMRTGNNALRDFCIQQVKWVAGMSPYSVCYIEKYNNSSPKFPHHRNDNALGSSASLTGGVVSGPSPSTPFDASNPTKSTWSFSDSRGNYQNTEVALDYNAGMIGAIAFIRYYNNPPAGLVRINQALKCVPDLVDFNTASPSITVSFETSIAWKIVLTGKTSGAIKTYSGTGITVTQAWDGSADASSPAFNAGELVTIKLDVPNIAEYHVAKSTSTISIKAIKDIPLLSTDVLVDNFNDANTTNVQGGTWTPFSDKTDLVAGGISAAPTLYFATGKLDTKGLDFRLTPATGADPKCYAGVASYFNTTKTAVSMGDAKSIVFDILPNADSTIFRVELEQPDITDKAYYGKDVICSGTTVFQRVRLLFSAFTRPSWATGNVGFNKNNIKSIRFVKYGIGSSRMVIDNVNVDGLNIGSASIRNVWVSNVNKNVLSIQQISNKIICFIPKNMNIFGKVEYKLFTIQGKAIPLSVNEMRTTEGIASEVKLQNASAAGVYFLTIKNGGRVISNSKIHIRN